MRISPDECRLVRNRMLEFTIACTRRQGFHREVEEHLRKCPGCRSYSEGIGAAFGRPSPGPLVTPALRRRTLAAVDRERGRPTWLAPLLLPASLAGMLTSVLAPVWLLSVLLRPLCPSEWVSLGLSLFLSTSAGLGAVGLGLGVLARRRRAGHDPAASGRLILEVFRG
jgi:predicted anti-sigma-YlaC factor YlaD